MEERAAGVEVARRGAVLELRLAAPASFNALSASMVSRCSRALSSHASEVAAVLVRAERRPFCSGGDVRALVETGSHAAAMAFFRAENELIWNLARFANVVSICDGVWFGGGCGVSLHARYRVASEKTRFAMPETSIGLFPDVGVSRVFRMLPDGIGAYLALTGRVIGPQDCLYLGLATHFISNPNSTDTLEQLYTVQSAAELDTLLAKLSCVPPRDESFPSSVRAQREVIRQCFAGVSTVEEVFARLEQCPEPFAAQTLKLLHTKSPTSLRVSLAAVLEAPKDLQALLERDLNIAANMIQFPDFDRGVRAVLIDKQRSPLQWEPVAKDWRNWLSSRQETFRPRILTPSHDDSAAPYHVQIFNNWQDFPGFACYGCAPPGTSQSLGLAFMRPISAATADYNVVAHHFVRHASFPRVAHGGLLATLMDEAAYFSFNAAHQTVGLTGGLSVKYLRPVRPNAWVSVYARQQDDDDGPAVGKKVSIRVRVVQDGKECATASVIYMIPPNAKVAAQALGCDEDVLKRFTSKL